MSNDTAGDWAEYDFDAVVDQIHDWAGNPDIDKLERAAESAKTSFEEAQARVLSIFSRARASHPDDKFLEDLADKTEKEKPGTYSQFVAMFRGKQQWFTRDSLAAGQGVQTPPHYHVLAQVGSIKHRFGVCAELAKLTRRAGSHLESLEKKTARRSRIGTHVFIGHGRSPAWKDFRDFIRDRLKLPWDEFNRVPAAGVPTTTRLMQMLDDAAIAFLILTAEDEQADGKFHPRMNVVHEAGLFQGRLGLERAIILLEDGCEESSNVHGLGQLRFPRGNIAHVFEDVRRVLEREGMIDVPE